MDFEEFCQVVLFGAVADVKTAIGEHQEHVTGSDEMGFTPLHLLMTEVDRVDIAELLIKAGADVHARNDAGHTPLHIAQGSALVRALVVNGADVNARGNEKETPLIVQAAEGMDTGALASMESLLEAGADPDLADASGRTALSLARRRDEREKIALLERHRGAK